MAKRFEKAREYTEKYKNLLLPCKYCKCKDIQINSARMSGDNKNYWYVTCLTKGCDCTGNFSSVKKAIESWNERQAKKR